MHDGQGGTLPPAETALLLRQWRGLAAGSVLLDGFHALKHALRFGATVPIALAADRCAVLELARELAPDLTGTLSELLREVPAEALHGLVPRPHPTGVAALAVRGSGRSGGSLTGAPADGGDSRPVLGGTGPRSAGAARAFRAAPVVVLDNPRHLGNVGAVIRLAAGAGAAGVLTTGTVDPWHPHVVRASAGLHFATVVEQCEPSALPPGPLFALDPDGEDIRTLALPDDALIAFGSERHGLSAALRERADQLVALPMQPQVSSYNLATSVAMTLYHWMAGRRPTGVD
ncbi:TrmH family RNA methyltransferase [Streptomyces ovatisporus]|uniref:TrmH family RNA methyltransferase n=1 Tax=Streptomyces ovatisporus TaxID=1128682 RepID=A0ABV9A718_9ACTN